MSLGTIILFVWVAAPAPDGARAVSIDEAVELALGRSPLVAAGVAGSEAARARTGAAESAWLPRVGLEARYRYIGPVPELVLDTGLTLPGQSEPFVVRRDLGSAHNADAFVTVGWRALDLGVRSARIDAATALERAATSDTEARAVEVAYATRVAYLGLLLAQDGARTTAAALAVARETRDDLMKRKAAGLGSDLAQAGAELRVAELEARVGEAAESEARARSTLERLVGRPVTPGDTLASALTDRPAMANEHPALARLRASEAAFEAQERALRRSRAPTLDVFARAGVQYPATLVDTDEAGLAWAAGATLTWEIFDGGRISADADEARARASEARAAHAAQVDELARAQDDAEARRVGAEVQVAAAERRRAAAETYLTVARGALQAGTGRVTDVHAAEVGLDEARLSLSRALHQRALAEAQRRRALGLDALEPSQEITP